MSDFPLAMHILHYLKTMRLEEGGVVRAVLDFCTALAGAGHEVVLATFDDKDVPADWARVPAGGGVWTGSFGSRPRVVRLPRPTRPGARFDRAALDQWRAVVKGADVAHVHAVWIPTNLQVARAARGVGTPYIVTVHGMLDDWSMSQRTLKKKVYLALGGRAFLENAAVVHSTAEFERRQSVKWYPRGRAVVAPLLFDLAPFAALPGPEDARRAHPAAGAPSPRILFLSRLHEKKGLDRLLRALAILGQRGVNGTALIAGTGDAAYAESMKRLAQELGLADRAHFLGMVTGSTKVSLFQAADVFVLPTSQENFGFAPIEAMAAGCPVVTTRGVDIWPELEESGGALIAPADPEPLASALGELLRRPDRLREMGESGRRWVFERLDAKRVVGEYVSMYQQAASTKPGGA